MKRLLLERQVARCHSSLEEEMMWLEKYRQRWDARLDELDKVVQELTRKEKSDEREKRE